ncbi:MAG: UTP--glucose-1-phosphate uridylyltransferase [Nitrospirae bacterium]|nr:UTP--glucose-1-phosphate uridylyltransferase [Nitrospirota bacterium]
MSDTPSVRNRSIDSILQGHSMERLFKLAMELESFRKSSDNLYHKVRASLFLFFIYRFRLLADPDLSHSGKAPLDGIKAAGKKDFERAISVFLEEAGKAGGRNVNLYSAIAESYHKLSFQYLFGQVKLSISRCSENYHLYNINGLDDYPYLVPPVLTLSDTITDNYPVGVDASPVRIDPSHSGWSDIFFLGMDFPEGARVVNISVDLRVHGSNSPILPPCECYCRYIEKPAIRLSSIDLRETKDISTLKELFNFSNDYLSLLKAGVVASGIVPPCFEKSEISLPDILAKLLGKDGGIEIVTSVNNIPKGSRLAVSTTLLAAIITQLMRFSGQIKNLTGPLSDEDRRIVASRAILGEWLGGSGGGWQDSGGLWPGIKVITGRLAESGSAEFGISRGCLLPDYTLFTKEEISTDVEDRILKSMVLVHGGISQDVGSILEMVTEKYLLKHDEERAAREKGIMLFDRITDALRSGNMKELGRLTSLDWEEAIQPIIPGVNNAFTDDLIKRMKEEFKDDYWGFLMLGGMSGGGMAFIVNPEINSQFKKRIKVIMRELKDIYSSSYPFVIDPIVYDFNFNHKGIIAKLLQGKDAKIPEIPKRTNDDMDSSDDQKPGEAEIMDRYGFDKTSHEHIRSLLIRGDISLEKNRLPITTIVEDVGRDELFHEEDALKNKSFYDIGTKSLSNGEVAVVTFAAGMGSRWSHGAAVAKPINPFLKAGDRYRTFIEAHLAKSRKTAELFGKNIPHIFTTSYLTHDAIEKYLKRFDHFGCEKDIYLSPGKSIARRVYPMVRDLQFIWEKKHGQSTDDENLKAGHAQHTALIEWTKSKGEGKDYSENKPILRFNPPGHWYEIPNMLKNGTMAAILKERPALKYILSSNIDTLGVNASPELLGLHISNKACVTFEVIPRYIEDKGGGLAKVNGRIQLIEGLALPGEDDEFSLSYYSTLTNWITIDSLLAFFGLDREIILRSENDKTKYDQVIEAIHDVEMRTPAYVTIKNVKYLWGNGQEDVYPVAQFEKLWGDITGMNGLSASYVAVSRYRGQQLKEPSDLDRWMNDGSFEHLMNISSF